MPKLYGSYRSRAFRVLWLAEEIGLDLEVVPVVQHTRVDDPEAEGAILNTRSAALMAVSPMGQISVLVDGDLTLTESLAINLHLARAHGGDLGPQDEAELAVMEQWTMFAATAIEPVALSIQRARESGAEASEIAARIEVAATALARPLAVLEVHLARHGSMVGGRFTVADVNVAEPMRYAQGHAPLMAAHPGIDAWLRACQARPAFVAAFARRTAEPVRP